MQMNNLKSKYLIEGRIVELKNGSRGLVLNDHIMLPHVKIPLSDYNVNMIKINAQYQNVIKVFKLKTSSITHGLEDLFHNECLQLLWNGLNFEKLKVGDSIMVKDCEEDDWIVRHFVRFDGKYIYALSKDLSTIVRWDMGKEVD